MLNFLIFYTYEHLKLHPQLSMKISITSVPGFTVLPYSAFHNVYACDD